MKDSARNDMGVLHSVKVSWATSLNVWTIKQTPHSSRLCVTSLLGRNSYADGKTKWGTRSIPEVTIDKQGKTRMERLATESGRFNSGTAASLPMSNRVDTEE